ncbi:Rpn family recombination-promoting nuclease/putative transposase [Candidatus Cardinium sp. cByotN1]|uniref:Rpn family recombination-promoting nuclease/putative transposase n=1 Tax=Candidatus Cardinium sp. cByotN1 TaxID=2699439 RepID=UPI00403D58BD
MSFKFSEKILVSFLVNVVTNVFLFYAIPDDQIKQKQHLGMLEYFIKYVKNRDILKLWDEFLANFKSCIILDKKYELAPSPIP